MKVTVWSALSGKISGHLVMSIPGSSTVRKLLETYCTNKGVPSQGYVIRSKDYLLLNPNKTLEELNVNDGDTLTLGLSDDEEQTFAFGSWWMVTSAALFIGTIGLLTTSWLYIRPIPPAEKYGIVMDAGSSHSEIFVYSWGGEKPLDTAEVKLVHRCFMAGGVSSFVKHIEDLDNYLDKCLHETKLHIPSTSRDQTQFYIGATAGMRILRDFDLEGANLILATLREILLTKTSFKVVHENIDIIEGFEEGVSGWISVNHLLGNLKESGETAAALDVGGASMQISREIVNFGNFTPENLTLFRHNFTVLSQSFLCYGIGEAQHRYDYFLVNEDVIKKEVNIIDPCLAKGVLHNISESDLSGPCTRTDDSTPLLMGMSNVKWHKLKKIFKNYKAGEEEHKVSKGSDVTTEASVDDEGQVIEPFIATGSSNASQCDANMRRLFDVNLCKKTFTYGDCINSESVPLIKGDLVAFSGMFERMMQVLKLKPGSSLDEFKKSIYKVCSLDVQSLYGKFPDLPKALVEDICFDAMYIYNLMTAGLGITDAEWKKIQFTDEINNSEVEWPMGFMMNRTTSFPSEVPTKSMSFSAFILLFILFTAFIISGGLFLWHSYKIRRQSTSYQRCGPHQA